MTVSLIGSSTTETSASTGWDDDRVALETRR
jgi:hypothetical protein